MGEDFFCRSGSKGKFCSRSVLGCTWGNGIWL